MVKIDSIFFFALAYFSYRANCDPSFSKNDSKSNPLDSELEIIKTNSFEAFCFLIVKGAVYDLNSLIIPDHDYNTTDGKFNLYYNFCEQSISQCSQKNTTALAVMNSKLDKNSCFSISGSKTISSKWNFLSNKKLKFLRH